MDLIKKNSLTKLEDGIYLRVEPDGASYIIHDETLTKESYSEEEIEDYITEFPCKAWEMDSF